MRLIDTIPIRNEIKLSTKHKLLPKIKIMAEKKEGSLSEYLRRTKSARS